MAKPREKSREMNGLLENLAKEAFGRGRREAIEQDVCVVCGKSATEFKDELSRREYTISGMCQVCQDETFNYPQEEEEK